MTLVLAIGAGFGKHVAVALGFVHIASHIRPVIISTHVVIHRTLSRMTKKEE